MNEQERDEKEIIEAENRINGVNNETLGAVLPKEINRCLKLLDQYAAIGPAGRFGLIMITQDIANAQAAMAQGDVVAMLKAYHALKGCK